MLKYLNSTKDCIIIKILFLLLCFPVFWIPWLGGHQRYAHIIIIPPF